MTTLHIAYEVNSVVLSKIVDLINYERLYNPNWSGADINILRDDYTWLDNDSLCAHQLFSQIQNIIMNPKA